MATNLIEDFRKGDKGGAFKMACKKNDGTILDISGATALKMIFKKKDATEALVVDAVLDSDGKDGVMKYIFLDGDLSEIGDWMAQGFVRFSATEEYTSNQIKFKVGDVLQAITE